MRLKRVLLLLGVALTGVVGSVALNDATTQASETARVYDFRAERLAKSYDRWKGAAHPDAGEYELVVPLSWFPGISKERSEAGGVAVIDMIGGSVSVEVGGIDVQNLAEVWLVDNRPGEAASAMPDANDAMHLVGSLQVEAGYGVLRADVGTAMFGDFDVDQVVVARAGEGPVEGGVLYGSLRLFERLHRASWRVAKGWAPVAGDESSRTGPLGEFPPPTKAAVGSDGALRPLAGLLEDGEDLFDNELFDGNGRTCATCHPADNNFTLDKDFIDRLPADDPLFVAEFIDDLNHELNGGLVFENPVLMREFALIVVNADGFEDLANKFVMRSPNHLFAQALSLESAFGDDCSTVPPIDRVGWGGDGSHGSGTLREFALAAVIQHSPLTLARIEGEDFRLPTDEELDALEAFQLSLGRQEELDLDSMNFTNQDVIVGRSFFNRDAEGGKCFRCHSNGGALRPADAAGAPLKNMQFDVGIYHVPHPAEPLGELMPFDDGFGASPFPPVPHRCNNTFSPPSLIEAADTPPYDHNNVFATLEEAVGHYSTDEFNVLSHAGRGAARSSGPVDLTTQEINQIAALLRVLNALQNIDDVLNCNARVVSSVGGVESRRLLGLCVADNLDALEVLSQSPLGQLHPTAQVHLRASADLHRQAQQASSPVERDAALAAAGLELAAARADMLDEDP